MKNIKKQTFLLEASLHGLAKWLRFMGINTLTLNEKITTEIIQKHTDKFFLVTSKATAQILEKMGINFLLLPRGPLKAQLTFLLLKLELKPSLSLELCSICGEKLIPVKKDLFKERIPPKVWELCEDFNYCARCDKLYWEGDHVKRMWERFRALIGRIC